MRLTISIPDGTYEAMLKATATEQLKTLKSVSISDFIRRALDEKLGVNTENHTSETTENHTSENAASVKVSKRKMLTDEDYRAFVGMQKAGKTGKEIAAVLGCSVPTVGRLRKRYKAEK